jgi:hypothetical protein
MDCCAHAHAGVRHPWMGSTPLASVGAMLAGAAGPRGSTEAARTAATRLAREVRFARDSLTGGGALLSNLDLVLRHATGLPISIADEPLTGVALGAGRVLEEMQTLKNVMINMW